MGTHVFCRPLVPGTVRARQYILSPLRREEGTALERKIAEKEPMRRLGDRYLKWTAYGLLILLVTLLQATKGLIPPVFGVRPLLVVPLTVCIAMFTGPVGGAAAGIACGILWDLYAARLLGFNALLLLVTGCLCGLLITLLMRNNLLTALLLSAAALLFVGLMNWLCYTLLLQEPEPVFILLRWILPSLGYTLVLAPLLYGATCQRARILKRRE